MIKTEARRLTLDVIKRYGSLKRAPDSAIIDAMDSLEYYGFDLTKNWRALGNGDFLE